LAWSIIRRLEVIEEEELLEPQESIRSSQRPDNHPTWSRRPIIWILRWMAMMWHIRAKDAET
jgi:hypothetical protein